MATSGTVSTTLVNTLKVIDHAFRRCKMLPQQITAEHLTTALDLLHFFLSTLSSQGIPLWRIQKNILPLYQSYHSITTPLGTVDVLNCNLRTQHILTGTAFSSEGTATNAFDEDFSSTCTQTSPAGNIGLQLSTASTVTTLGILPNVSGTWSWVFESSDDGVTYSALQTKSSITVTEAQWLWYDLEGVLDKTYYRLRATGTTVLDVIELKFQNTPTEIPLTPLNRDDYTNLPNKFRIGRPVQYWFDKQPIQPILTVWPGVSLSYVYAQLVCNISMHIEDVGTLQDELNIPQRWYMSVITNLASQLGREIKEVKPEIIPILDRDAAVELQKAWNSESDGSNIYLRPNISCYTK